MRLRPGSSSTKSRREFILMLRRCSGDAHDKRGSGARLALQAHGPAVRLYDSFDQVQAESGAVNLILHGFFFQEERVEYALLFLRRNSRDRDR